MNWKRFNRKIPVDLKLISIIPLIIGLICIVLFLPNKPIYVILFTILLSGFSYLVSSYFVRQKYQILISLFILLFLTINYIVGFEIINTLLLASFIIGMAKIFK
jgi:hypothetical protein